MLRILAALVLWTGAAEAAEIVLEGSPPRFVVRDAADLARVGTTPLAQVLQVTVAGNDEQPIAGSHALADGKLSFQTQFPLTPGVTYLARYSHAGERASATFTLPKAALVSTTVVERVYPTTDALPENALKFYIHFSKSMSRGGAYQWLRLVDEKDGEVERPFLELQEELWDENLRRLTVLLDPGRIKRGLVPNFEAGPPLREGHRYRLEIDGRWPDATGAPLKQGFTKTFITMAPERRALDMKKWRMATPKPGSGDALTVAFPWPLDHALMNRLLRVVDAQGAPVRGQVTIDQNEKLWTFTPNAPWGAGSYVLKASQALEDLSGNKINRPFDADISDKVEEVAERQIDDQIFELPFVVGRR